MQSSVRHVEPNCVSLADTVVIDVAYQACRDVDVVDYVSAPM